MNNHILNLKGISVEKNDVCILEDINLEIKQGDFLNIYGSNGAGKTTLLKLLSGLTEPSAGEIKFNNDNFMDKVFILGHKNGIKLNLTVLENLQLNLVDPVSQLLSISQPRLLIAEGPNKEMPTVQNYVY